MRISDSHIILFCMTVQLLQRSSIAEVCHKMVILQDSKLSPNQSPWVLVFLIILAFGAISVKIKDGHPLYGFYTEVLNEMVSIINFCILYI